MPVEVTENRDVNRDEAGRIETRSPGEGVSIEEETKSAPTIPPPDRQSRRRRRLLIGALSAAGVPVAEPVYENNRRFMDDPQQLRLGRVGEFDHPRYGKTRQPGALIRFEGASVPPLRRAPELGEHTDEVLAALGIAPEDVARLRDAEAIR